jgi:hypothetical protein
MYATSRKGQKSSIRMQRAGYWDSLVYNPVLLYSIFPDPKVYVPVFPSFMEDRIWTDQEKQDN